MYRLKYSWKDLVVEALRLLGGEAHLKEINKKVGFLFLMYNQVRLLPTYKKENIRDAIIRRELQQGSEDSGSYLGHENLFYHKGGDTKDHKKRTGVWGLRFKNTFWFVSQSKTFKEERSGCYLWAPYKSKIGSKQHHYDTLGSVKKGDIIFSNYKGTIPSISVALDKAEENSKIPDEFKKKYPWDTNGRKIRVKYLDIKPLDLDRELRKKLDIFRTNEHWILDRNLKTVVRYLLQLPYRAGFFLLRRCKKDLDDITNFNENSQISLEIFREIKKTKSRKGGQGYNLSKEDRDIVDKHAMELVMKDWIKNGWKAKDSSKIYGGGRDFEFYKGNKTVYCEVKGTTGDGSSVNLTHTQVKKMKLEYPNSALHVVYGIYLDKSQKPPKPLFGKFIKKYPWKVLDSKLSATRFSYDTSD